MPFHSYDRAVMHTIIPRTEWATRNAIETDLIKLKLPVKLGVVGHHTGCSEHQSSTKGSKRIEISAFEYF